MNASVPVNREVANATTMQVNLAIGSCHWGPVRPMNDCDVLRNRVNHSGEWV